MSHIPGLSFSITISMTAFVIPPLFGLFSEKDDKIKTIPCIALLVNLYIGSKNKVFERRKQKVIRGTNLFRYEILR